MDFSKGERTLPLKFALNVLKLPGKLPFVGGSCLIREIQAFSGQTPSMPQNRLHQMTSPFT